MRVLITGATGFLGSRLVERLHGEHDVIAVTRRGGPARWPVNVAQAIADLRDPEFSAGFPREIDAVLHLAVVPPSSGATPLEMLQVNAVSTLQMLEYAAHAGARRFIYGSTGSVYAGGAEPQREDSPIRTKDVFAASKRAGELMVEAFEDKLSTATLRFFYLYGPGQRDFLLVTRLLGGIERGEPVSLHRGGGPQLSFTYIDDAVEALVRTLASDRRLILNVAHARQHSVLALAEALARYAGRRAIFAQTLETGVDLTADVSRLEKELGFAPRIDLEEGLERTFAGSARPSRVLESIRRAA